MTEIFQEIEERFAQKMRDAVAEISAEDPPDQDWGRLERMAAQYGGFLELFPEAIPPKPAQKAPVKPTAKKAPAKKSVPKAPVKRK